MDIANFIIGQLVGLAEPLLVLGFIIKCLGWKESIKHQKRIEQNRCAMACQGCGIAIFCFL